MKPGIISLQDRINRRIFLRQSAGGMGLAALASLAGNAPAAPAPTAKAKRVIYLFQSGAPSQADLFDPKPGMEKRRGEDLPASIRMGQRLTTMTSGQGKFPVAPSAFKFKQHGKSGMWFSEVMPSMASLADDFCMVRSMHTEAINHDPAITFIQTGSQLPGRPSIGSWLSYGLGSENKDLPAYVVMTSFGSGRPDDQPLYDRLWSSGFLPSKHQGVKLRNKGDAVLYLSDPPGLDRDGRRSTLDRLSALNQKEFERSNDPETQSRIAQYEMAFRMQSSVPELMDLTKESKETLELYGTKGGDGSFAANCLLARRLAERGVRFIQLYHRDWDHHGNIKADVQVVAKEVDQGMTALLKDLKRRGLWEDTLIVWGGEFGRTPMAQGNGRDHHMKGFSMWMSGGAIKGGTSYGNTDEFGYHSVENVVTVHDMHATMLHLLGVDHERLTFRFQGRDFRLTDISGKVIKPILA